VLSFADLFAFVHDEAKSNADIKSLFHDGVISNDFLFAWIHESTLSNEETFAWAHDWNKSNVFLKSFFYDETISFAGSHHERYNGDLSRAFCVNNIKYKT
jgi:hypothetical protein